MTTRTTTRPLFQAHSGRPQIARRGLKNFVAAGAMALVGISGSATASPADEAGKAEWRAASDLIIARPIGAVITAAGAVAFVVGLPFSAIAGTVRESAQVLVVGPARETFVRCIGCINAGRVHTGETSR